MQEGAQARSHHITRWITWQLEKRRSGTASGCGTAGVVVDCVVEHHRRRGRDVQQDVVERRIVGVRETTTNYAGVIPAEQQLGKFALTKARRPGKSQTRRPVVFVERNGWRDASVERQGLQPERLSGIAFAGGADLVQEIDWLASVFVAHAEVQCQVVLDFPVVLEEEELIILRVIER